MPSDTSQPAQFAESSALPRVRLEVLQGTHTTSYEVSEVGFLIGSVPGCDLRVPGVDLPAVLAMISRLPDGVEFRRLAPTKAMLVNGRGANRVTLNSGDRITFGGVAINVTIQPVVRAAAPPPPPDTSKIDAARAELQQQMLAFREQVVRFEKERHVEQEKLQRRHDELEQLASTAVHGRIADLQEREQGLARRLAEIAEKEQLLNAQTAQQEGTLARRLAEKEQSFNARIAEHEQAYARRLTEISEQERALNERAAQEQSVSGRLAEIAAKEQALAAEAAEHEQRKQQLAELRQELATIRGQLYERYRERRDRLAGLQESVNHAARKVQEQKRQLDAQVRDYAQQRKQDAELRQELTTRTAELTDITRRLDEERERLEAAQADLDAREQTFQSEHAAFEEQQQQYKDDLVLLSRLQVAFEHKEADLQKRAAEFDQRVERLQLDSHDLEEQARQVEEWRTRLAEEERRLNEQKSEQETIAGQLIQRAASIEGQQTTLATLRTRLERMRDEVRQEEQQLADARARQEAAEQELQQQMQELTRWRSELEGEQQLRSSEREQLVERSAMLEAGVAKLRQAQEQFTQQEEQIRTRHNELDARAAELDAGTRQLADRHAELEDAQRKLEDERQTVRERTLALAQAEQVRESLQEQLRRRSEELNVRQQEFATQIAQLDEQTKALDEKRATIEQQCQQQQEELARLRQTTETQSAELGGRQVELRAREETLEANVAKLKEAALRIAADRKLLAEERAQRHADLEAQQKRQAEIDNEFQATISQARELLQHLPDLELRAGTALERTTHVREQLREHLGEFHSYTRRCQDDLEELHTRIQADSARLKQQEQTLRRMQDEHRLEVAAFRQQLIDWQGQFTDKKRTLAHDETRLERKRDQVIEHARQIDATSQTLARQAQHLQEQERQVADRRQEVDRHLHDMRKWYRRKLRELAGIEAAPAAPLAVVDDGEAAILSFPGTVDEADQKLGELLASLELIEGDTLTALLVEARRQRRSLRQILLASGTVTLYQMALIEAGNIDALMLGPVRVIDRLRVTPRETVYRVFDPRSGHEAVLRHLAEHEMQDAVHPDEFRQRFGQACIAHPHLAATLEVLEIAGRPAAMQEWVVGLPCPDWPPLAAVPGVCLRLVKQAALGLLAVHQAGLVHGHLQDNLLFLTAEGNLKICGLGEPPWLTATGCTSDSFDQRADLQALGRIAANWSISGVRRGARTKPIPDELSALLKRLASSENGFADTAELLVELERLQVKIPANNEAWDRLIRHIHNHAMPELVLRQSA